MDYSGKRLVVIGGPTASGKTAVAIQLARHFGTEILSADSRQFYREMSIGTAKPDAAERAAAPHHFIDFLSVTADYSVGDFERDALQQLEQLFVQHDVVILAGGSGLYVQALCEGLDRFPAVSEAVKQEVAQAEARGGLSWMQETLAQLDPEYYEKVDRQNPARLRRAIEVCLASGQPFSSFHQQQKQADRFFKPLYIQLEWPRAELYERINARVDRMMAAGLEQEARELYPFRHRPALQTVGYQELFDYFDGQMDFAETVEKIKQHSRNYAKRQLTWFGKYGKWKQFPAQDVAGMIAYIAASDLT